MNELLVPFEGWISRYIGIMIFFKYRIVEIFLSYFLFSFLMQMLKPSYPLQILALSHLAWFLAVKVFLLDSWLQELRHQYNFPSTSLQFWPIMNNWTDQESSGLNRIEHARRRIRQKNPQDQTLEHLEGQAWVLENKKKRMYWKQIWSEVTGWDFVVESREFGRRNWKTETIL